MPTTRLIERPSWWYEPDDDPYTDAELEMAWDDYTEKFGHTPDYSSKQWQTFFDNWLEWWNRERD